MCNYAIALTPRRVVSSRLTPRLLTLCLLAAAPWATASADTEQRYLEAGGYIHFEAENAGATDAWSVHTGMDGYSGSGYLEWTGSNYFAKVDAGNGTIVYHVSIETAGNYEFRWLSRIAKGDSNTESNDSWVRLATGSNVAGEQALDGWTKVYMGEADVWSWSARTVDQQARPVRQFFTQGEHTVEISGRSNGHAIDRIALYRYEDVSFDPGLNGTLPLSQYRQGNDSLVDPNPIVIPQPESLLDERINATPTGVNTHQSDESMCTANTLTLPAVQSASLDQINQYELDTLVLQADLSRVLLSFDLSALPLFSAAELHYANAGENSNGSIDIYLGSHNDWPDDNPANAPSAQVKIASAQGGWAAGTQYASELDPTLLPLDEASLLLSLTTGSDTLKLAGASDPFATARLVITGDNDFCADWAANVVQGNSDSAPIPDNSTDDAAEPERKSSGLGAFSHWLFLIFLIGLFRKVSWPARAGQPQPDHSIAAKTQAT